MKMTALLLFALAAVALLRGRSAALRHWVLAAAVIGSAMMPLLEMVLPAWPLPVSSSSTLMEPSGGTPRGSGRGTRDGASSASIEVNSPVSDSLNSNGALNWTLPVAARTVRGIWLFGAGLSLLI